MIFQGIQHTEHNNVRYVGGDYSTSWRTAADDLVQGLHSQPLWTALAWNDIRQRYKRSI